MAKKKAKKQRKPRPTEWNIGQPFDPPTKKPERDDAQNALDIVKHAIGEPLAKKKPK